MFVNFGSVASVVGPGEARWLADPEGGETVVARSGEVIETPVIAL